MPIKSQSSEKPECKPFTSIGKKIKAMTVTRREEVSDKMQKNVENPKSEVKTF